MRRKGGKHKKSPTRSSKTGGRRTCCSVLAALWAGGWLTSARDERDRNGMVNISPVGRNATVQERNDYEKYDAQHQIRSKFVAALKENFRDYDLTYVPSYFLFFASRLPPYFRYGPLYLFVFTCSLFRFNPPRVFC